MLVLTNEVLALENASAETSQDVDVNSCWIVHSHRSIKVLHSLSYGMPHEHASMMVPSRLVMSP